METVSSISRQDLFRTYLLFSNVTNDVMPWASYRYDSLQLRIDKRFTSEHSVLGGLTMVVSLKAAGADTTGRPEPGRRERVGDGTRLREVP